MTQEKIFQAVQSEVSAGLLVLRSILFRHNDQNSSGHPGQLRL